MKSQLQNRLDKLSKSIKTEKQEITIIRKLLFKGEDGKLKTEVISSRTV